MSRSFDGKEFAKAVSRPGIDPRQWISYGTIEPEEGGTAPDLTTTDDNGNPSAVGPLLTVKLHPSGMIVSCRVGSALAGNGEGEWHPFVQQDEVLVAIPEGNERAGCVILCRLNNSLDVWPAKVAGMDATKNTVAFKRMRAPFAIESGEAILLRNSKTTAQLSLDQNGSFIANDGNGSAFILSSSVLGFGLKDNSSMIQINAETGDLLLQSNDGTQLSLSDSSSSFISNGTLSLGTGGIANLQHAITLEQVINLFANFLCVSSNPAVMGGLASSSFTGAFGGNVQDGVLQFIQAMLVGVVPLTGGAAVPIPMTSISGGGDLSQTGLSAIITAALQVPNPYTIVPANAAILAPGVGRGTLTL